MSTKHALITGGNKGIGFDTTRLLLDLGYTVTIVARDFTAMPSLENCKQVEFDLANVDEIPKMVSKLGTIDILINNAGILNTYNYKEYPAENKQQLLKVNLEAPVELIRSVSEQMIQKKAGRIVNVASIAGQIGHPDVWYGISKAGLINATKSFAKILGPHGVIVNAVAPGIVETEMLNSIPKNRQEAILKSVHYGRFAKSEEVAKTIIWLATESPAYINGTCVDINNGAFPR